MYNTNLFRISLTLLIIFLFLICYLLFNSSIDLFLKGADSSTYVYPGLSFSDNLTFLNKEGEPMHNNTPLYSIFLSIFFYFFNFKSSFIYIQITQIIIFFYIVYITINFNLELNFTEKNYLFIILLINPNLFANAFFAQTEIIFSLFFIVSIYYSINFINNSENKKSSFLSILFICLALNVRPIGQYYLIILILFFNYILIYKKSSLFQIFKINFIYFLIIFIVVFPWILRNKIEFNEYIISSNKGYYALDNLSNLIKYSNNLSDDESYSIALEQNFSKLDKKIHNSFCLERENIRNIECKELIFKLSLDNILSYEKKGLFKAFGYSFINTFFSGGSSNLKNILNIEGNKLWKTKIEKKDIYELFKFTSPSLIIFIYALIYSIFLKILSLKGLFRLSKNNLNVFIFLLMIFSISIMLFMFVGNSRFRVPLEPLFGILAVYSLKKNN